MGSGVISFSTVTAAASASSSGTSRMISGASSIFWKIMQLGVSSSEASFHRDYFLLVIYCKVVIVPAPLLTTAMCF